MDSSLYPLLRRGYPSMAARGEKYGGRRMRFSAGDEITGVWQGDVPGAT